MKYERKEEKFFNGIFFSPISSNFFISSGIFWTVYIDRIKVVKEMKRCIFNHPRWFVVWKGFTLIELLGK